MNINTMVETQVVDLLVGGKLEDSYIKQICSNANEQVHKLDGIATIMLKKCALELSLLFSKLYKCIEASCLPTC